MDMDKIVAQKFWILFGVAPIVALVGWWMGTSKLAGEIDTQIAAIESAEKGIPNPANHPNDNWTQALGEVNQRWAEEHKKASDYLWKQQQDLMVWPSRIAHLMKDVPYLGQGKDAQARVLYRTAYYYDEKNSIKELFNMVHPLDEEGKGKIAFKPQIIPMVPPGTWQNSPPSWKVMWFAQEDIWLAKEILKAIDTMNRDSGSLAESTIREIVTFQFHGGSRVEPGAVTAEGGMGEGGMGEGGEGMMDMMGGGEYGGGRFGAMGGMGEGEGEMGMGGMPGAGGSQAGSIDFPPAEEFGPPTPDDPDAAAATATSAGMEGDAGAESLGGAGAMSMEMGGEGGYPGMMGGQGGQKWETIPRYIDKDPSQPFKTRGFYLKLVMDLRKLPEFVAELNKMRWPVRIVRIHQQDMNTNLRDLLVHGGAGGMGGMGGGYGSGSMMGDEGGYPGAGESEGLGYPGAGGFGGAMMGGPTAGLGLGGGAEAGDGTGYGGGFQDFLGGSGSGSMGGGRGVGAGVSKKTPIRTADQVYRAAMNDPELGYVVIAGLMTIYQPPPEEQPQPGLADAGAVPPPDETPDAAPTGPDGSAVESPSGEAPADAGDAPEPAAKPVADPADPGAAEDTAAPEKTLGAPPAGSDPQPADKSDGDAPASKKDEPPASNDETSNDEKGLPAGEASPGGASSPSL